MLRSICEATFIIAALVQLPVYTRWAPLDRPRPHHAESDGLWALKSGGPTTPGGWTGSGSGPGPGPGSPVRPVAEGTAWG